MSDLGFAAGRRARRHEGDDQPGTPDTPDTPDTPPADPPADPTPAAPLTDEQKAAAKAAAEQAEAARLTAIAGYAELAGEGDTKEIKTAATPTRHRKPEQLAMDKVAVKAYAAWVAADRPTLWAKMPTITYFLDPEEVADYRSWIRKACEVVTPTGDATGVRARFGTPFPLTEKMARKIGKPEEVGKTVLMWAAVDKRKVSNGTGATAPAATPAPEPATPGN